MKFAVYGLSFIVECIGRQEWQKSRTSFGIRVSTIPRPSNDKLQTANGKQQTARGFSLIELLVSMALLGILGGIGITVFAIINNSYTRANAISKMQTQGQQNLEVLERTVRSSTAVNFYANGTNNCASTQCAYFTISTASIEYTLNGGCPITAYGWTGPSFVQGGQVNGQLTRYSLDASYNACNGSTPTNVFDGDPRQGISVEQTGGAAVFVRNPGTSGPDSVAITYTLAEGAALKPISGTDTRASVPFHSTVALRDY